MNYKDIIEKAISNGHGTEESMWKNVELVSHTLDKLKESHPDIYWKFMRKAYGKLYDGHYNDEFAKYDVEQLRYTDASGDECTGAYWTKTQVSEAFKGYTFKSDVTECDKYVAANVMHADLCKRFEDTKIIEATYLFFFLDEDWQDDQKCTKIWDYMSAHHRKIYKG